MSAHSAVQAFASEGAVAAREAARKLLEKVADAGDEGLIVSPEDFSVMKEAYRLQLVERTLEHDNTGATLPGTARYRWTITPAGRKLLDGGELHVIKPKLTDTPNEQMLAKRHELAERKPRKDYGVAVVL